MAEATPNVQLRTWREEADLTRAEMAKMINLSKSGIKYGLTCDEERIRRWEAGEVRWPREPYRHAIKDVTHKDIEDLGFAPTKRGPKGDVPANEIQGFESPQTGQVGQPATFKADVPPPGDSWGQGLQLAQAGDEGNLVVPSRAQDGRIVFLSVSRRTFLQGLGLGFAGASLPSAQSSPIASRRPVRSFGDLNPIEHFKQIRKVLVANDNLLGPLNVIPAVQQQITAIQQLRRDSRGADQRQLIKLQLEYSEFCGWLHQDAGNYAAAQFWTDRALELSHAAADSNLTAFILTRKSQIAGDAGDSLTAIDMAEAASSLVQPEGRLQVLASLHAGYGYALRGDESLAKGELDRAHNLLLSVREDPNFRRASWLDESYIEAQRARSLSALGDYCEAVNGFQDVVATVPPSFRRDLGVYLSRESIAHAGVKEPEQAATVATEALYIAEETGSARIMNELIKLDVQLQRWHSVPAVAEFHSALTSAVIKQA
ncbi:hypothetical protein [Nonomuraea sp. B19D2]|uniref:helix-turn-helix transcriptional regulator n=1 Tax=Nonomuraea sp. B19D2 TaxID=3159561 RepID=UPI0032DAF280